jgi:hypothetical protein
MVKLFLDLQKKKLRHKSLRSRDGKPSSSAQKRSASSVSSSSASSGDHEPDTTLSTDSDAYSSSSGSANSLHPPTNLTANLYRIPPISPGSSGWAVNVMRTFPDEIRKMEREIQGAVGTLQELLAKLHQHVDAIDTASAMLKNDMPKSCKRCSHD